MTTTQQYDGPVWMTSIDFSRVREVLPVRHSTYHTMNLMGVLSTPFFSYWSGTYNIVSFIELKETIDCDDSVFITLQLSNSLVHRYHANVDYRGYAILPSTLPSLTSSIMMPSSWPPMIRMTKHFMQVNGLTARKELYLRKTDPRGCVSKGYITR